MGQRPNDYQRQWMDESRDQYLETLYDFEGGGDTAMCRCGVGALWRCLNCLPTRSFCARCLRLEHLSHPLHRVESWTGSHYASAWLQSVHVQIHLGHGGLPCPGEAASGQAVGKTTAPSSPVFTFRMPPSPASELQSNMELSRPMLHPRRVQQTLTPSSRRHFLPGLRLQLEGLPSPSDQSPSGLYTPATANSDGRSPLSSPGLPPSSPCPSSPWSEEATFTRSRSHSVTPDLPSSSEQLGAAHEADGFSFLLHASSPVRIPQKSSPPPCQSSNSSPGLFLSGVHFSTSSTPLNDCANETSAKNIPQLTMHLGKRQRTERVQGRRVRPCLPLRVTEAQPNDHDEEEVDDEPEQVPPEEDDEYSESPYVYDEADGAAMPRIGEEVLHSRPSKPDGRQLPAARMMTIVDISGVHELPVVFCSCIHAERVDKQLLRMGLYPATQRQPRTMFTFQVLDDFLLTNKECKTSAMNYYNKLRRVTNDSFPHMVPVSKLDTNRCMSLTLHSCP